MISEVNITNFKCYKHCNLKFEKFNVVCGPNSSGKSTINQAILLLLQNNHADKERLITNGKFVHFDEFEEMKNDEISQDQKINITIVDDNNQLNILELEASKNENKIECIKNEQNFSLIEEEDIYFLSAERIGPEDVYDKYNNNLIGIQGQNAVGFIAKNKDKPIDKKYAFEQSPTKDYNFLKEINFWLKRIIGEEINAKDLDRTDRSFATYKKEGYSIQVRNKNTGSGISYIISIITMVFSVSIKNKNKQPMMIIENPEIHLHPVAQIKLMEFLTFMSKFCQIIVETHSDHIIKYILEMNDGQIIKLNNFRPQFYTQSNKHILPKVTIGEVKWAAFDLPTIDFHVSLYSFIQSKFKKYGINETDDMIRLTGAFKRNVAKYETGFLRHYNHKPKILINPTETLPTYMRNLIDHPNSRRNLYNSEHEFDEKLKESIEFMIEIIKEKGWK